LNDVTDDAIAIKVAAPAFSAEVLTEDDLWRVPSGPVKTQEKAQLDKRERAQQNRTQQSKAGI